MLSCVDRVVLPAGPVVPLAAAAPLAPMEALRAAMAQFAIADPVIDRGSAWPAAASAARSPEPRAVARAAASPAILAARRVPPERGALRMDNPLLSGSQRAGTVRALSAILRTLLVAVPLLLVFTLTTAAPAESLALAGLLLGVLALYLLLRAGRLEVVFHGLVIALIAYGIVGSAAYGSIRSVSSIAFIAAIVVGGMFLGRGALIAAVAASAAALAALIWAEHAGRLPQPDHTVQLMHWVVHGVVLSAVALNVYYARSMVIEAVRQREDGEARFRNLFERNPAASVVFTLDEGRILDCNPAYEQLLERSRGEIIGRTGRWRTLGMEGAAPRLRELMLKYADRPMDLADASMVWAAEHTENRRILTTDRTDFDIYRTKSGQAFEILT
jgi:PAS domain-containing protein